MTTPEPSKADDLATTLNRLRKNYAQNPFYAWLFSASCNSLFSCMLTLALMLLPKAHARYPGAPAAWSIYMCASTVAYGGYRLREFRLIIDMEQL